MSAATGYIKLWRCLELSDVWKLPPVTRDIWLWILMHVTREAKTILGVDLQPGEMLTSYSHIAEGVSWVEGKTKKMPSVSTVRWAIGRLAAHQTLQHESRHGSLWVKVLQWELYQGNGDTIHDATTTRATATNKKYKKKEVIESAPKGEELGVEVNLHPLTVLARETILCWKPGRTDDRWMREQVERLGESVVRATIYRLADREGNYKYRDGKLALSNWLQKEKPAPKEPEIVYFDASLEAERAAGLL